MLNYLWNRFKTKMKCKGGFLNFLVPALMAATSAGVGAIKGHQDKDQYGRDMKQRKKRRTFAAFTGDMPNEANKPRKPSMLSNIVGMGLQGAKMGSNIMGMAGDPYGGGSTGGAGDYMASTDSMQNVMANDTPMGSFKNPNLIGPGKFNMGNPYMQNTMAQYDPMNQLMASYGINPYKGGGYGRG